MVKRRIRFLSMTNKLGKFDHFDRLVRLFHIQNSCKVKETSENYAGYRLRFHHLDCKKPHQVYNALQELSSQQ